MQPNLQDLTRRCIVLEAAIQKCQNKMNKIQTEWTRWKRILDNEFATFLYGILGCKNIIDLCHEYADLDYCVQHQSYFPRQLKLCLMCLVTTDVTNEKGTADNWVWYELYHFSIEPYPPYLFCALSEEGDELMIRHLQDTEKCGPSFQKHFITFHFANKKMLLLGIMKCQWKYAIVIVSKEERMEYDMILPIWSYGGSVKLHKRNNNRIN
jgi:hypothetical protein